MGCLFCTHGHTYGDGCLHRTRTAAPKHHYAIGEGKVTFNLNDGSTFEIDNVEYDSISPVAANKGVICVELFGKPESIVHVPFVRFWTISF